MQHMFCETVVLYTYEDGALHKQTLLYEVPVDQLPKNASTPLDEMGTMSSHGFRTYPVDDLSGLSQSGVSSGSNADIVALLKAEASAS